MSSLHAHLEQHDLLVGALSFRRDCPICRLERVQGRLPSVAVVPPRACAAMTAAVLATSALAPGIAAATDGQGVAAPAPESPPPPQVSDVEVGGGAAAPAGGGSSDHDEPRVDATQSSDRDPRPDEPANEPASGAGVVAPPRDEAGDSSTTPEPEHEGLAGSEPSAEPSPSPAPRDGDAVATEPDDVPRHDTPASVAPTPAAPETASTALPRDSRQATAPERASTEPATRPTVDPRRSVSSDGPTRASTRRAARNSHRTARDGTRGGGANRARATRVTEAVEVASAEPTTYTVRPGDSLWRIAERRLGQRASTTATAEEVTRLWRINQQRIGTGNPDLIFPGQTLQM